MRKKSPESVDFARLRSRTSDEFHDEEFSGHRAALPFAGADRALGANPWFRGVCCWRGWIWIFFVWSGCPLDSSAARGDSVADVAFGMQSNSLDRTTACLNASPAYLVAAGSSTLRHRGMARGACRPLVTLVSGYPAALFHHRPDPFRVFSLDTPEACGDDSVEEYASTGSKRWSSWGSGGRILRFTRFRDGHLG